MTDTETPARYRPEPRQYEDKQWLYEQYWGQLKAFNEIAEDLDCGERQIREQMAAFGIPRRVRRYTSENSVSAFTGFYDTETTAQPDEQSTQQYDPDFESDSDPDWFDVADRDNAVNVGGG